MNVALWLSRLWNMDDRELFLCIIHPGSSRTVGLCGFQPAVGWVSANPSSRKGGHRSLYLTVVKVAELAPCAVSWSLLAIVHKVASPPSLQQTSKQKTLRSCSDLARKLLSESQLQFLKRRSESFRYRRRWRVPTSAQQKSRTWDPQKRPTTLSRKK